MTGAGKIRIGTSGWSYESWHGSFYPPDLPRRRELFYASRRFDSLEVNGSFYSLLEPETYERWYDEVPAGFRFAVKGSRFITHNKKLLDVERPLANFLASGVLALAEKLGPIVWQLHEKLGFDEERFDRFLELLPHDTEGAAELAAGHDDRVKGRSRVRVDRRRRLRHALEVRNEEALSPELVRVARRHGVALVVSDAADWPRAEELTAGFVYVRLHGSKKTYESRYSDAELDRWAEKVGAWTRGAEPRDPRRITGRKPPARKTRDVYLYFDNDQNAHAPEDARRLRERLE
jgi:uncharacterized protein YecE (DUF72 family)